MSANTAAVASTASVNGSSWRQRLGQWLADFPNPIVVKELRQAVRGWTALALFLLYLVVQLIVIGVMLMIVADRLWSEEPLGVPVFLAVQVQLVIVTVGLLPLYAGTRLFLERSDVQLDLMFITPLRPVWLVLGKLLATLVLGLLFFSASAPVMTMAYFLRGLDLVRAALLLGLDVVAMLAAVQAALFIAAIPGTRADTALFGVGLVFGLLITVGWLIDCSVEVFSSPHRDELPIVLATTALSQIAVFLLLFTATHALLSPPPSNRLLLFKVMLLVVPIAFWPATLILGELVQRWLLDPRLYPLVIPKEPILWLMMLTGAGWLAWCLATSERLEWNPRLLAQVPRQRWLRVLVFPFYTGAANGLVFACLLTGLSWLLRLALAIWLKMSAFATDPLAILQGLVTSEGIALVADAYVIAYALTALWLRRRLEWRRGKVLPGWVILLLMVGLVACASLLVAIVGPLLRWPERFLRFAFVFTPFPILETCGVPLLFPHEREETYQASTALLVVWLAIVVPATLYWWLPLVRRFAPPPRQ